jgi:hypothetical protein
LHIADKLRGIVCWVDQGRIRPAGLTYAANEALQIGLGVTARLIDFRRIAH